MTNIVAAAGAVSVSTDADPIPEEDAEGTVFRLLAKMRGVSSSISSSSSSGNSAFILTLAGNTSSTFVQGLFLFLSLWADGSPGSARTSLRETNPLRDRASLVQDRTSRAGKKE